MPGETHTYFVALPSGNAIRVRFDRLPEVGRRGSYTVKWLRPLSPADALAWRTERGKVVRDLRSRGVRISAMRDEIDRYALPQPVSGLDYPQEQGAA